VIRFSDLESLGLSIAAMSERSDGDCRLPAASNEFAGTDGRRKFLDSLGLDPARLVCVRQVHGTDVTGVSGQDRGRGGFDAANARADSDAMITSEPGMPIGISVADCVPLIVFDPVVRAVAVGHAGRLGTMGNIADCIVEAMKVGFGSKPEELHTVIGPSAGPQQYEVSEAIADEFASLDLPRNGRLLDLWGANRAQFERAGIPSHQVHVFGHCTMSDTRFFSHRGDGTGGRNLAVVSL